MSQTDRQWVLRVCGQISERALDALCDEFEQRSAIAEKLRVERDAECGRAMKAEAKLRYYERAFCIGPLRTWVQDDAGGDHAVFSVNPERVTEVLTERDFLRRTIKKALRELIDTGTCYDTLREALDTDHSIAHEGKRVDA